MTAGNTEEFEPLEQLVRSAGAKLLEFWPGGAGAARPALDAETKGDGSPVTAADLASNEILMAGLRKHFPAFGILSEEVSDRSELVTRSEVWIIDPLDGTRSFIQGNDDFSVLVGLVSRGEPRAGFMYFPARDVYARALKGQGASIDGKKAAVSNSAAPRKNAVYYRNFSPSPGGYLFEGWMDSGLAFLSLCSGELDGVIIRMTSHKEWDVVAPMSLVLESGGRVSDENGKPILFNKESMDFKYVVASNGRVHETLLGLIPRTK